MKKNDKIFILFGLAGLTYLFIKRKPIMEAAQNIVWDLVSATRIATLHPAIREKVIAFINEAEKQGIKLRVTDAFRSYDEQNKLFAKGRTTAGKIVTNARGGQSLHNFGLAIDVVPIVNGKADYNTYTSKVAEIGKGLGFEWGGDFKSIKDNPHFQMRLGYSISQLNAIFISQNTTNGFVNIKTA